MKKFVLAALVLLPFIFAFFSCGECEHKWNSASCDSPSTCTLCGKEQGVALGHNWVNASCFAPKTCYTCGVTEGEAGSHSWTTLECGEMPFCPLCGTYGGINEHKWVEADCENAKTCTVCHATTGVALGHNYVQKTCREPLKCSTCGNETTEGIIHSWRFIDCTTPRVCAACDLVEKEAPGHDYSPATCTLPSVCNVCKTGKGKPLGHDWREADCENPKSCTRCPRTEGEALGHTMVFVEDIPSSCSDGRLVYECHCGKQEITTYPSVVSYHLCDENAVCTVCNFAFDKKKLTLTSIVIASNPYTDRCGVFTTDETTGTVYKPIMPDDINMPVVDLNGDISQISKTYSVTIPFKYNDGKSIVDCNVEIKVQGASSAGKPKKNYSIKLYNADGSKNKVEILDGWGKEFKYCLKANWVDYSQARNVVSAQIFGDVIRQRDKDDELSSLVNGGAIDGFPVVVYNNGIFLGLYTFNIPKDKWMFDMEDSDEKKQAIVMGEQWSNSVAMNELISYNSNNKIWTGSSGWELEFASNEESEIDNSTLWVAQSLNNLISFVMNNDGQAFIDGISKYADVDKCIDSMIYTFLMCADDNISKNILWVTYDGTRWFSSVYDMDGTWGMRWDGQIVYNENDMAINNLEYYDAGINVYNALWKKLYLNFYDQIADRYWELRESVYTVEHIGERFTTFFEKIPDIVRIAERSKWAGVPTQYRDHLEQIIDFATRRLAAMDKILIKSN